MYRTIATSILLLAASQLHAGSPTFPWQSQTPVGATPVRVLTPPATSPVVPLPPKQAYPYGWFGSKPTAQWHRSFGSSNSYTQWSRR